MKEKYTNYEAIDFAADTSFVKWVRHKDSEASNFWEGWQKAHPEKASELKEAKAIVQAIRIKEEEPSQKQIKNLWDKINKATNESTPTATIRTLHTRRWIGYAAAASIALFAFFYFYNPTTTIDTGNGKHLVYELPDQSKVELNADSKISYKASQFDEIRLVILEGEAFFEVEKGITFKVVTDQGEVEVLGTSFNVNTRNGSLEVECRTGKVRVTSNGHAQILTKGQGTKYNTTTAVLENPYPVDLDRALGWRKGEYYFTDVPFSVVIQELERQYDIKIEADQVLKQKVGAYIFTGTLKEALANVSFQLNARTEINGNTVTFISND